MASVTVEATMACLNHWIPAFAGMTEGLKSGIWWEWQKGWQDDDKPTSTSVVIPAKAGIQEGEAGE